MGATSHLWLLIETLKLASVTAELNSHSYLILTNLYLNSPRWLVATELDSAYKSLQPGFHVVKNPGDPSPVLLPLAEVWVGRWGAGLWGVRLDMGDKPR